MTCNSKFVKFAAMSFMQITLASATTIEARAADTNYELKRIDLPRASGPVALDYFAYDRATEKVWVPASNTGSVDVIDEKTDTVSQITGFPTGEIERRGRKITVGPTASVVSFTPTSRTPVLRWPLIFGHTKLSPNGIPVAVICKD